LLADGLAMALEVMVETEADIVPDLPLILLLVSSLLSLPSSPL
jgi:hypothetical protein